MLARWLEAWQARREAAAVARRPIPDDLWKRTLVRYPFLQRRDAAAGERLRRLTSLFLDRKEFSAADGLQLTDAMAVAIAAQAVLPVLELGLARYDGFVGIVVHPDLVVARRSVVDEHGLVHEYDEELAGEAMAGGPVMLSWRDVRSAGRDAEIAYNVVIHEFAHVLDLANGESDGMPELPPDISATQWRATLDGEYESFAARVEAGARTWLDPYGAQGEDEFFAVASEAFFVDPWTLRGEHGALYALFARYYRQDPARERPQPRRR
ncbi:MAG: zinc-dependent peptidase [Burkholderiales bacterium]|nr:zinc-dependent peptidase [Burkholderiales bacterium]MDE1928363.1 zinc-dependent peptidase [Burkholderiales bacterium]MDE2159161.1 zinc-dependent peptidase [Burkholderiales bacterium]MDE2502965.1 zinc-dependent peptidase [Burkholderiales bacterium]